MSGTNIYSNTASGNTYYYFIDSNGDEWYSASKEDLEKVQNGTDASTLSSVYSSEDELESAEFSDDETDDTTTASATNSISAAGTYGIDASSYDTYCSSIGLSNLTENSKVKDYQAVLDQIEEDIENLNSEIASINANDPQGANDILSEILSIQTAITNLGTLSGAELNTTGITVAGAVSTAVGVGVPACCIATSTAAIGAAVAEGAGIVAATAAAVPVAGWVVAGVAAVVGVGALIYSGVQNSKIKNLENDMQEALNTIGDDYTNAQTKINEEVGGKIDDIENEFKDIISDGYTIDSIDDVPDAVEQLSNITEYQESLVEWQALAATWSINIDGLDEAIANLETAQENVKTGVITKASEDVEQINTDISSLLDSSGSFNFDDITDIDTFISNIDLIIDGQTSLKEWITALETAGIDSSEVEGLDSTLEALGGDSLTYAQNYLESYVTQVNSDFDSDLYTDTGDRDNLLTDLNTLLEAVKADGLDTASLESLIEKIQTDEDEAITETADDGEEKADETAADGTADAGSIEDAVDTADELEEDAGAVDSTESLDADSTELTDTADDLIDAAQTNIDTYLASVSTAGLSISQLEELYNEVSAKYTELSQIDADLDLSGFDTKLAEIRTAQQTVVNDYLSSIDVSSATTVSDLEALYASVSTTYTEYSGYGISSLDLSGFDTIFSSIIAGEQALVDASTQSVSEISGSVVFDEENIDSALSAYNSGKIQLVQASLILAQVTVEGVDTSALNSAIETLKANIEEFESQYKAYLENDIILSDTDTDTDIDTEETGETNKTEGTDETEETGDTETDTETDTDTDTDVNTDTDTDTDTEVVGSIGKAEQSVIDDFLTMVSNTEVAGWAANEGMEYSALVSVIDSRYASILGVYTEYSGYGISELDLSGFETVLASIAEKEQNVVDECAASTYSAASVVLPDGTSSENISHALISAQTSLKDAESTLAAVSANGVDTSNLASAITALKAKIAELEAAQKNAESEDEIAANEDTAAGETDDVDDTGTDTSAAADTTETEDTTGESDGCEEEDELNTDMGVSTGDSDDDIEIEQTEE